MDWYIHEPLFEGSDLRIFARKVSSDQQPENSTQWPPLPPGVGRISYFNGSGWHALPDIRSASLQTLKAHALRCASFRFEQAVDALHVGYPKSERQTWDQQVKEAQLVRAGLRSAPLLSVLASACDLDVWDLAGKVLQKHAKYAEAYGQVLASYQAKKRAIRLADSQSNLPQLTYSDLLLIFNMGEP
jgi:hypothetical protein